MTKVYVLGVLLFFCSSPPIDAQNNRLSTHESIGWYNYFGTIYLSSKVSLHTEYQWRRVRIIADAQQNLLRTGINYRVTPNILARIGYAWIETFAYGEIPINALGRTFTEHRFFQMIQLNHKESIVAFSHRFILEQRFVGRYSTALASKEDEFPLMHRIRYMLRLQLPFKKTDKTAYWVLYNESFIGFGKNVNANVFDQNRLGMLIGYRWNNTLQLEGGYLNQILQFGRQVEGKNVFQYNNGVIINAYVNFLTKLKTNSRMNRD